MSDGQGKVKDESLPSRNGLLQIGQESVGLRDFLGMRSRSERIVPVSQTAL